MRRKEASELALAKAKHTLRRLVHLKYSLQALEDLNNLEPELEDRFRTAVDAGKSFTLDVKALVDRIDRG